jgi:hypothetical protein
MAMAADVVDLRGRTAELVEGTRELLTTAGRRDLAESLPAPPSADRAPVDPQVTTCIPVLLTYDDPEWAKVWIHRGCSGSQSARTA